MLAMSPRDAELLERSLEIDAEDVVRCLRCPCGGAFHHSGSDGSWICVACRRSPSLCRLIAGAYLLGVCGGKEGHAERVGNGKTEKWESAW